jgi:hypothetical protein
MLYAILVLQHFVFNDKSGLQGTYRNFTLRELISDTIARQTSKRPRKSREQNLHYAGQAQKVRQKTKEAALKAYAFSIEDFMNTGTAHHPVILLLGKRLKTNDEVDAWLAESRYSAYEATDVFQALEQISDFTVRETPDVVYLHVDRLDSERAMLESMLATTAGDSCASVISYCDKDERDESSNCDRFVGLARQLDKLIPQQQVI